MRYREILEAAPISALSDAQRHDWLVFIHHWLSGSYMGKASAQALAKWRQLAKLFPPKVSGEVRLYRLVTLPIAYASKKDFIFRPAKTMVSSWSKTLVGIDAVAGVAVDQAESHRNARLAIQASLPAQLILATPQTIRDAFMTFSHDYFDRYKERVTKTPQADGRNLVSVDHPGFPATDDTFTMDEVGFYQDVLNRPGGHYRQYEYIVQTPPSVRAKVVRIYRIGDRTLRQGNDDPHQ